MRLTFIKMVFCLKVFFLFLRQVSHLTLRLLLLLALCIFSQHISFTLFCVATLIAHCLLSLQECLWQGSTGLTSSACHTSRSTTTFPPGTCFPWDALSQGLRTAGSVEEGHKDQCDHSNDQSLPCAPLVQLKLSQSCCCLRLFLSTCVRPAPLLEGSLLMFLTPSL